MAGSLAGGGGGVGSKELTGGGWPRDGPPSIPSLSAWPLRGGAFLRKFPMLKSGSRDGALLHLWAAAACGRVKLGCGQSP